MSRPPFIALAEPVLEPDHITLLFRFEQVRAELLHLLAQGSAQETSPDLWHAQIVISAIVFGGARPELAKLLASSAAEQIHWFEDNLWIDIHVDKKPSERWVADSVTGCLLLGAIERFGPGLKVSDNSGWAAAKRLAADLLSGYVSNVRKPVQELGRWARAWRSHHLPGPLAALGTGTFPATPAPLRAIARQKGQRVVPTPRPAPARQTFEFHGSHRQASISLLKTLLTSALGTQPSERDRRSGVAKERAALDRQIEHLANLEDPRLARLGAVWLAKMLRDGGKRKSKLAPATITTYFTAFKRLADTIGARQIDTLSEEELEQLYRDVLMDTGIQSRARTNACLRSIHQIGEEELGLVEVEWAAVSYELDLGAQVVDANLVHQEEVDRALALLDSASNADPLYVPLARLCLGLMWCSATRIGEALRLRVGDIQSGHLLIRNTAHGTTKTSAGVRVVPRVGAGWAELDSDLSAAMERAHSLSSDPRTPLFCSPDDPTQLVSRRRIQELVAWALRCATQDASVRPHHLRHSRVTRNFDAVVWPGYASRAWLEGAPLREALLGDVEPTRRAMQAVAVLNGHAHPTTTLLIYVHGLEFHLAGAMDAQLGKVPLQRVASLGRLTPNQVRKRSASGATAAAILRFAMTRQFEKHPALDLMNRFPPLPKTCDVPPLPPATRGPSGLVDIRNALLLARDLSLSTDAIAYRTGLAPSQVKRIGEIARDLRRSCGVVISDESDAALAFRGAPETRLGGSGSRQFLRRAFEQAEKIAAAPAAAEDIAIVCKTFVASSASLALQTISDVVSSIRALLLIGLTQTEIVVTCPGDPASFKNELHSFAPGTSNVVITAAKSRIEAADRKRPRRRAYRIHLEASGHAAMHLTGIAEALAVWLIRYKLEPNFHEESRTQDLDPGTSDARRPDQPSRRPASHQ